jgi:alkanesulfonate monooxygenase SsuD/methylene tetrahydromethanopterin reductase-like flavin-dependent oxidoreductase (luciferase family)
MLGATGPRMLAAGLPHVDAWNTWYDVYGNTPEGFAALNATVDEAARAAGREPADIERSACVLVAVNGGTGERPVPDGLAPVEAGAIAVHLRALAAAGADEAILVVDPIDEPSIRALGAALR